MTDEQKAIMAKFAILLGYTGGHTWHYTHRVCTRCGLTMREYYETDQLCTRRSVVSKRREKVKRRFGLR